MTCAPSPTRTCGSWFVEKKRVRPGSGCSVVILAHVAFTFACRTWRIGDHFWLLGDQIRDWGIALRPLTQLPLVGRRRTSAVTPSARRITG
jgi:hypothetical protein